MDVTHESGGPAAVPAHWFRYHWLATGLVGLFTAVSTLWLNLSNSELKTRLDEAGLALKRQEQEFDQRLRDRASALEESRERVARYDFVSRTLSGVDPGGDPYKLTLAVNIVRLALSAEEQSGLFANLELAPDPKAKQVGRVAQEALGQSRTNARKLQNDGFEALTRGDLETARAAFDRAEAQAPGEGVSYEMGRLLRRTPSADPKAEQTMLQQVKKSYLQFAPPDTRRALEERAQRLESN